MQSLQEGNSHPPQFQCTVCLKLYKRREHLQRHRTSRHTSERPHKCISCDRTFQRSDVLNRHRRTCAVKGTSSALERRRACDRCVRQKKACSLEHPCQRCEQRGVDCCYSEHSTPSGGETSSSLETVDPGTINVHADSGNGPTADCVYSQNEHLDSGDFPDVLDYASPSWQDILIMVSESQPGAEYLHSLHFLHKMTSDTGLVHSFDCGTHAQRAQVLSKLQEETVWEQQQITLSSVSPSSTWLDDPMSLKTHQILLLIKDVVMVKPRNSAITMDWSARVQNQCLQFFSPSNIRKMLGLYWAIWHPNVNFVHRPTFDPSCAKPATLATMVLIGACVSPDTSDNEDARMWFDCVEELVFTDEDFNNDLACSYSSSNGLYRNKVQALQAAYMVCLYQNWEGNDASKRRIRRHRLATLVSTARDIDITTVKHTKYSELPRHSFDWKEFAMREELIRVLIWIFLLDTAFVLFNNIPPRMVIREMKIHMAIPDACFHAPTADHCYEQIHRCLPPQSPYWKISFCNAFKSLCQQNLAEDICSDLATLGPLNLFSLTSAIHSQIFQYRNNSWATSHLLVPINNAISNWRGIWQLSAKVDSNDHNLEADTMWERVGFCKYCPEYWSLADFMVSQLTAEMDSLSIETGEQGIDEGPLDSILKKYDQTSMRQVSDLISSFQKCYTS